MNHLPISIGLMLCEVVIVDEKTRNVTPVNCFGARKLTDVPGAADFHVVAWLTDGLGDMPVELVVQRLDSLDIVFRMERRVQFEDRMKDMRFIARVRDCSIPIVGYYEVKLFVDGQLIANRKVLFHL